MKNKKLLLVCASIFLISSCSINNSSSSLKENDVSSISSNDISINTSNTSNSSSSSKTQISSYGSSSEIDKPIYEIKDYTLFAYKEGNVRFEAEEVNTTNYIISSDNVSKIVNRSDASNGKFLAAATGDTSKNSYFEFSIFLDFNAEIKMKASYAQTNKWKDYNEDLTQSYTYIVDENRNMMISSNKTILNKRSDITQWEVFDYNSITLSKGKHNFKVNILANTGKGNPNIDYFDFNIKKVNDIVEETISPNNDIHTNIQYSYINDDVENIEKYANGVNELSKPKGIKIEFDDLDSDNYILQYADNLEFNNYITIKDIKVKEYYVQNLMLGQKLFYRVGKNENDVLNNPIKNLNVNSIGPRNINIDGVSNVRDIGGYKSTLVENGKIKQGLYYRGANVNNVTEIGKKEMIRLRIKQEIDLRDSYQCLGPYINGIEYNAISIPSGTESTRFENFNDEYKKIFSLIEKANEKPIYLHCTAGADRTGICSFVLLTVCGAEYNDIARDYLFTNFSTQGSRINNYESEFKQWWSKLDSFDGLTKADKAKSWLISKGITSNQVENIRTIFVDNYKQN